MERGDTEARPLTSVELLDAAVWREIGSEEPQRRATFVEALAAAGWALIAGALRCARNGSYDGDMPRARVMSSGAVRNRAKPGDRVDTLTRCYRCALLPAPAQPAAAASLRQAYFHGVKSAPHCDAAGSPACRYHIL